MIRSVQESFTVETSYSTNQTVELRRSQTSKRRNGTWNLIVSVHEEEPVADETAEPVLRRSERERRQPDHYGEWLGIANDNVKEPATVKEALDNSYKAEWTTAMKKEMKSLYANDVWDLVLLPEDRKAVGSKWVFKRKIGADGMVERYKARLVAQGFSQKSGLDYDQTLSPVVRFESLRTMIALAVQNGLKLHQMDVTTAFLNGTLKEEVYMKQPEGFIAEGQEHLFCLDFPPPWVS